MKKRREKKRKKVVFLFSLLFLINALGVALMPTVESNVARYKQVQLASWKATDSSENQSKTSMDVAKQELGIPLGNLVIPTIHLQVPIYEGTSEKVLTNGIGIVEGTGNLKGEKGGNPLLSGHSGLYKGYLFDDLDRLEKGQKFYIQVKEAYHAYQIFKIEEIEQQDLKEHFETYLQPNLEEDQVTLMTCTPKGVNTHRLLVHGRRVSFKEEELKQKKKQWIQIDWLLFSGVGLFGLLLFLIGDVLNDGR